MLKLVDAFIVLRAIRLGYEILSDSDMNAWWRKGGECIGPYSTLEEAANHAVHHHNKQLMQELFGEKYDKGGI